MTLQQTPNRLKKLVADLSLDKGRSLPHLIDTVTRCEHTRIPTMTIVTYRRPKRPAKPAQATGIVTAEKPRSRR
jgi:hypothetical protein